MLIILVLDAEHKYTLGGKLKRKTKIALHSIILKLKKKLNLTKK